MNKTSESLKMSLLWITILLYFSSIYLKCMHLWHAVDIITVIWPPSLGLCPCWWEFLKKVGNNISSNKCSQTLLLGLVAITVFSPMLSSVSLWGGPAQRSHMGELIPAGLSADRHGGCGWRLTRVVDQQYLLPWALRIAMSAMRIHLVVSHYSLL